MSSIPDMNKTSCYSFLDKHPPSACKQEGGTTPSFGFPPAIVLKMGSLDTRWAVQSGPTLHKVPALPEAQDGTSKHKQNLLNTSQRRAFHLNKAYYSFTLSISYVINPIPPVRFELLFVHLNLQNDSASEGNH